MKLVIISGRSGSGKSVTLRVMEDLGYYCVDNLPVSLLPALEAQIHHQTLDKIAVSLDARNVSIDLVRYREILKLIKKPDRNWGVIYLDADDGTLLQRFSETKRKHPLSSQTVSLQEAISLEKELLEPLASIADWRVDTRSLNIHQLRNQIIERLSNKPDDSLSVLFQSFGFKYGLPLDADFVFDMRTLPNPYWEPHLRPLTGLDAPIIEFFNEQDKVKTMLSELIQFISVWLPSIAADHRNYLTIAIGCTGGKHRSVFMAEALTQAFLESPYHIQCRHRELTP